MMSVRAYAKHRGIRHSAVQRAIETGRLSESVVRNLKGRPAISDATVADREWEATTASDRVSASVQIAKAAGSPGERAALVSRLLELVAELQADTRAGVAEYLPAVLEGAAEELQANGKPTTPRALAEALTLDEGLDGHALTIACDLLEAVSDPDGKPRDVARAAGRAAVAWRCKGNGGADERG
jgi:hypothetical protein